ncbi:MAG: peptide deformylase [Clostridia bacterium]|nr:peptide deformylase [Clostridia bacterium]
MIQAIVKDLDFLARVSEPATEADAQVGQDLLDTLEVNKQGCVGMAANMIGVLKRVIVFDNAGKPMLMYNPEIIRKADPYETEEGCLSIPGVRKTTRYRQIRVEFLNEQFKLRQKTFTAYTAQIIQHEIDHCNGILI